MRCGWSLLACCLLICGCKTTSGSASALASVEFRGNTPGQITRVVEETFIRHGYHVTRTGPFTTLFEREGSLGTSIMYGNWVTEEKSVWIRVKVRLVPIQPELFRLDCNACRVRDRGSSVEEEIPFGKLNRGHFQEILDECASSLKGAPAKTQEPAGIEKP